MKRYTGHSVLAIGAVAILAAAPVSGQGRQSLSDRVARLEAEQQRLLASDRNLETLNRITDLQAEIMALRGTIEELRFEIEQLKQRNREQYLDLDGRLSRLEGGGATAAEAEPTEPAGRGVVAGVAAGGSVSGSPGPAIEPSPEMPEDERGAYEYAFNALKDGEYAEAARRFQAFEQRFPDGEFTANAIYWLGESYYVTQNYELARETFERLLERHPDSAKAPDALLKLGYSQYELKRLPEARATLERVVERYPDSTVARLAQGRLRQMMLDAGN